MIFASSGLLQTFFLKSPISTKSRKNNEIFEYEITVLENYPSEEMHDFTATIVIWIFLLLQHKVTVLCSSKNI